MSQTPSPASPPHLRGVRLLLMAACLVIVVAGLRAGQAFFVPVLMAVFLTVLCLPPLRWMRRLGLPEWTAVLLVISGAALIVLALAVVLGGTIQSFYQDL